ncbi:MAG: hypothetical protein OEZ39_08190 [Gammaproteobacteria bacterium]|nr:hypothetical protein [Gammaproteobacteria bacterium]MDH5651840.1 hypothetical protein [Gammaproteobacteria bacterium]
MPGATVRQYAEEHGLTEDEVIQEGMKQQAVKFVEGGSEIYKEV